MNWVEVITFLKTAGYNQSELAAECRCGQSTISELATGEIKDPRDSIGQKLRELYTKELRKQRTKARAA